MDGTGKWFDEIVVGEVFSRSVTITEAHLVMSCGILGDFNPLHVDEEFARKSRFGGRILHGMMTSAIMGGPIGMYFYGTAIAYLEHNARFRAPVRPGDTLKIAWTVTGLVSKPKQGGGIVELVATATNQEGAIAVEADGKVLAANRPAQ
ncbi:MAG: MaoC family dehydratase [Betaproteobacteria bacterium]